MTPRAAVIIPHFNDVERLHRCLTALVPQLSQGIELVVVDNGSSASLDRIKDVFPNVEIVVEHTKGAAAARNRGVVETSADQIFFLDCDCVPSADWLSTAMRISSRADVVGGRVEVFDETPPPRSGAQAFETVFAFDNRRYVERKGFSVTANLLTRREVFLSTGPFRVGFSEDFDWCRRAATCGFSLAYAHEMTVCHPTRGDWAALSKKWRRLTDEGFRVNGDDMPDRLRWLAKGLAMPFSVIVHMPRVLMHQDLRGWRERAGALLVLARLRLMRMVWMVAQAFRGS